MNHQWWSSSSSVAGGGIYRWRSDALPQFHGDRFSESREPSRLSGKSQWGELFLFVCVCGGGFETVLLRIRTKKKTRAFLALSHSDHLQQSWSGVSLSNQQWNKGVLSWHQSPGPQRTPVSFSISHSPRLCFSKLLLLYCACTSHTSDGVRTCCSMKCC